MRFTNGVWLYPGPVYHGSGGGDPEGVVTAPPGSKFYRTTGQEYRKGSGVGNTGWVEVVSGGSASADVPQSLVESAGAMVAPASRLRQFFAAAEPGTLGVTPAENDLWIDKDAPAPSVSIYTNIFMYSNPGTVAFTNMPAAVTEPSGGRTRQRAMLANAVEVRLSIHVQTAAFAGAIMFVQYSTDLSTWIDLTPSAVVDTAGAKITPFAAIPAGAKGDVWLRVAGSGGDGVVDPVFGSISVGVRSVVAVT